MNENEVGHAFLLDFGGPETGKLPKRKGTGVKEYCFVVFSKPVAGEEAEYNKWYDTQHLRDVLCVPGIVSARRLFTETAEGRQYLALYELRCDDPQAVLAEVSARAGTDRMPVSAALDREQTRAVLYEVCASELAGGAGTAAGGRTS